MLIERPVLILLIILGIWEAIWKGIALWKAGRNNQLKWYVAIFILNTVGILPIIYLSFFRKNASSLKKKGKKEAL